MIYYLVGSDNLYIEYFIEYPSYCMIIDFIQYGNKLSIIYKNKDYIKDSSATLFDLKPEKYKDIIKILFIGNVSPL